MEYLFKKCIVIVVFLFPIIVADCLSASRCVVTPTQIVTAINNRTTDQVVMQVTVGNVGLDPSTWITTILSDYFSYSYNFTPSVYANAVGDVVVVWPYVDQFGIGQIATSILLHGTTTWYTANISQSVGDARGHDQVCHIHENGSVLVNWTSIDDSTQTLQLMGATALLSTSTVWSAPFPVGN